MTGGREGEGASNPAWGRGWLGEESRTIVYNIIKYMHGESQIVAAPWQSKTDKQKGSIRRGIIGRRRINGVGGG